MRYSERAQSVIQFAQQEAARLRHEHVSTGHLLLGLIREGEGTAIAFLKDAKVDLEDMKTALENLMESKGRGAIIGQMSFTSRASDALKMSAEESRDMGHKYIGTEHLLVGLIRETEGVASRELIKRGVNLEKARLAAQAVAVEEDERSETLTFHNVQMTVPTGLPLPEPDMNQISIGSGGEVLDLEEASRLLRIDIDSMSKMLESENLPARMINGQWRFSRSALIRWLGKGNSRNYVD